MIRLAALALAGCALTANAPPRQIHYFSPEAERGDPPPSPPALAPGAPRAQLRLGHVDLSAHVRYRIVQRTSGVEVSMYETRRWTERPDAYVRRALRQALFARRHLAQTISGPGPMLEIEVLAFEEVTSPRHVGRVELGYTLHDGRRVLASGQVRSEQAVAGTEFDDVVRAIGAALDDATARLADVVLREVPAPAAQ